MSEMSILGSIFSWGNSRSSHDLPDIFPMPVTSTAFIQTDVINIYKKILTDTVERTQGMPENAQKLLWDNCLQSESNEGLVSMLARAMSDKNDLFIVYNKTLGTIRKADSSESQAIKADYEKQGKSSVGTYISFRQYEKTDIVKLYSSLEYCLISSLNKTMNLSKAVQFKMNDMRATVSLADSSEVKAQAVKIAEGLRDGKDVMLDGKDIIETAKPDTSAIKEGMAFIDSKRSFYLGLPMSYITGEQTGGIGSTGEADSRAVERGLKGYYFSIIKPSVEAIFNVQTFFKSNDFRQLDGALEALKTFSIIENDLISAENKKLIVERLLDIDNNG